MLNKKTRRNLIVFNIAVLLISSVPVTFLILRDIDLKQPTPGWVRYRFPIFYLEEPYLYANYREERFLVLNNSNYQQLHLLGDFYYKNDDFRKPLAKYGSYLFQFRREHHFGEIPEYINFLEIVDVSDYSNPCLLVELQLSNGTAISYDDLYVHEFVEIDNGLYFFLQEDDRNYFYVVNCTNMQQLELVDSYQFPGGAGADFTKLYKFYIRDNTVFIPTLNASSSLGIAIYNFTTINNLTKVGEWFGSTSSSDIDSVYVTQDYLYLKRLGSGVDVYNVQNLTQPTRIGYTLVPGYRIFCHKKYAFGLYHHDFSIYDCSNTSKTEPISSYTYPYDTYIMTNYFDENKITENYFFIQLDEYAWSNETLHIWDWSDPYNLTIKALLGLPTVTPTREPRYLTDPIVITPIVVGLTLIFTLGNLLIIRKRAKKKDSNSKKNN